MRSIFTPLAAHHFSNSALLVWPDRLAHNIQRMIDISGSANRLRPHCKTHKMHDVTRRLIDAGITHHKAATPAEAQMLGHAGAADVLLAANPVGPAIHFVTRIAGDFSDMRFSVTGDAEEPLRQLSVACAAAGVTVGVMLDIDVGFHRTGIDADSPDAVRLYELIADLPGLRQAGLHVYDGHQHQSSLSERKAAVQEEWEPVLRLLERLEAKGCDVPEIVCGGTPTFPVFAEFDDRRIRLSPGTCVLHDAGYGSQLPDLEFELAALLATRVVSRPTAGRITLDLGNKAVAADPPNGARVVIPEIPDAKFVVHNEEHLVVETERAGEYSLGDLLLAVPVHICPTSALHEFVEVIEDGEVTGRWPVSARHRIPRFDT